MDLVRFTGTGAFGRAYRVMLENDAHAAGSVDRELARKMVRLCAETAHYVYTAFTPLEVQYAVGSRPVLENVVRQIEPAPDAPTAVLAAIAVFASKLGDNAASQLHEMRLGGTEEEIIGRGSDWCTDVARVACALCQVAGLPSRIVYLFDLDQAYSGHVIIEAHLTGKWGAADPTTGVVYARPDGRCASVWDLMNDPVLLEAHGRDPRASYTSAGQFQAAAMANYRCWELHRYDYTVSRLNDYYRSILTMSREGWPGGLRWIHGEDT